MEDTDEIERYSWSDAVSEVQFGTQLTEHQREEMKSILRELSPVI